MAGKKPYGIMFDDEKHTFRDFGLRIKRIHIGMPDLKVNRVELPGADGYVDLTDYFGAKYENRTISVECDLEDKTYERWSHNISALSNYLHGKKRRIVLDWDDGYYYVGRGKCEYEKENRIYGDVTLTFDCEPYKYEMVASDEDWLWDPFPFETGVIRNYRQLSVKESTEIVVVGSPMPAIPELIVSVPMTVEFKGEQYQLTPGSNYFPDIEIVDGENLLTFKGYGTVTIRYRGGSL